jgi:hypothetical protein
VEFSGNTSNPRTVLCWPEHPNSQSTDVVLTVVIACFFAISVMRCFYLAVELEVHCLMTLS